MSFGTSGAIIHGITDPTPKQGCQGINDTEKFRKQKGGIKKSFVFSLDAYYNSSTDMLTYDGAVNVPISFGGTLLSQNYGAINLGNGNFCNLE
jgi:hypothetical protein